MDLDGVSSEGSGKGLTKNISFLRLDRDVGFGLPKLPGIRMAVLPKFEFSLSKMENLAVLQLSYFRNPEEFPEELGNLKNLHILCLSHWPICLRILGTYQG